MLYKQRHKITLKLVKYECDPNLQMWSDRCRHNRLLSDSDICPKSLIRLSDRCRCRTDVAQSQYCGRANGINGELLKGFSIFSIEKVWLGDICPTAALPLYSMKQEIQWNKKFNFSTFYRIKRCKTIHKNIMPIWCMTFCPWLLVWFWKDR